MNDTRRQQVSAIQERLDSIIGELVDIWSAEKDDSEQEDIMLAIAADLEDAIAGIEEVIECLESAGRD